MSVTKGLISLSAALVFTAGANAQQWYVGGSVAYTEQSDSDNTGETGAFTTGLFGGGSDGGGVQLDVNDGQVYGWNTEFDAGYSVGLEVGLVYDRPLRAGIEVVRSQVDVDGHSGVELDTLDGPLDPVDANIFAQTPAELGITLGELVADGRGEIVQTAVYVNAYYDFNRSGTFQPYVGAGIGFADVNVTYNPSGVGIIDDGESKFAYQLKAGATYRVSETIDAFGEYTYRATDDIATDNDLFPGSLDIENQSSSFAIGLRYRFE